MKRGQVGDLCLLVGIVGFVFGFFTNFDFGLQPSSRFEIVGEVIRGVSFYSVIAAIVIGCVPKFRARFDR